MARKVHLDTSYIFDPVGSRIIIDKAIPQEKLLLITNLNSNTVIFNFSDPNLKVSSYTRTRENQVQITGTPGASSVTNLNPSYVPIAGQRITGYGIPDNTWIGSVTTSNGLTQLTLKGPSGVAATITADPFQFGQPCNIFGTVITLNYSTASMNATDKLQIFVDEYEETIRPAETFNDPVSKMRVSTPQALIDTDFEVGLQPTKWESLQKLSNRASFFYNPTTPISLRSVKPLISGGNPTRTVVIDATKTLTGTATAVSATTANFTGSNTAFLSEIGASGQGTGSVIFDTTLGVVVGPVSSVTSDTVVAMKTGGTTNATNNGDSLSVSGTRYFSNGAAFTGVFSPTGVLTASQGTGQANLTGVGTTFTLDVRPGDYIFNQAGLFIGQVRNISDDLNLTMTANLAVTTGATQANNYFFVSQYTPSFTNTVNNVSYGNPLYLQLSALPDANGSWLIDGITSSGFAPTSATTLDQAARQVCYSMESPAPYIPVTGSSASGSLVTLSFATQTTPPFKAGQVVDIAGITASGTALNKTGATVIACTTSSLTYDLQSTSPGSWTSGGYITYNSIYDNPTTYAYPGQFFYQQQVGGIGSGFNSTPTNNRLTLSVTGGSVSGTVATLNFATQPVPPYAPGQIITVAGTSATTNTFNATAAVIDCTTTAVRYANFGNATGTPTSLGTISGAPASFYTDGGTGGVSGYSKISVVFPTAHGLFPGAPIFVVGQQANINGSYYVASVPNANTIVYVVGSSVTSVTTQNVGYVYVRPTGNVIHRPTDGGIQISCSINSPHAQMIRQSRRYFRYQSGKGIQYSTGTVFKPTLRVDRLQSDGTSVTVFCKEPHYLYPGATVKVSGAIATSGTFNGSFTVIADGLSPKTFKYTPASNAPATGAATGFPINVVVDGWTGAQNRLGLFDATNGMFFKYDGSTLYTVRRNSTELLSGNVQVTNGSAVVFGDAETKFSAQLKAGHYVMIRGQVYLVTSVYSDNGITISPEYRGTTLGSGSYAKIARIQDYEVPQSQWNIDKCDGNGPSGYNLDLSRIQMWYIDYTWYGAGAIRYGFKDQRGEVIYCNRIAHANNRTEAYLRSGNIGARYETNTIQPNTNMGTSGLAGTVTSGGSIPVTDASTWPTAGGALIVPPPTGVTNTYTTNTGTPTVSNTNAIAFTYSSAITAAQAAAVTIGSIVDVRGITGGTQNGTGVVVASSTTGLTIYYTTTTLTTAPTPVAGLITVAGTIYTPGGAVEYVSYTAKTSTSLTVGNRAFAGSVSVTGNTTISSNNLTNVTNANTLITPFMHVHGAGIPLGTYVTGVSATTVYMSNFATATATGTTLQFTTPGAQGAVTHSPSATQPYQVMYFNPMFSPTISHWGSSVIMDGRFDDDKALIFTAGMKGSLTTTTVGVAYPLISIRVGPSVDTGLADILGRKEIINRMQLILNALDVSFQTQHILDLRLNGQLSGGSWTSVGGSSLAQICFHTSTQRISGGESTYTFLTGTSAGVQTYNLDKARDLGNSILGGGYTSNVKDTYYPDGPDVITLVATPITAGQVLARISWTEAQA